MRSIRATPSTVLKKESLTARTPKTPGLNQPKIPKIFLPGGPGVLAVFFSVLAGCSRSLAAPIPAEHGEDAAPTRGGTLRVASFKDIRGLDPAGPTEGIADQAIHLIFAGLVDFDARAGVVPDLADHWEVADAGRT